MTDPTEAIRKAHAAFAAFPSATTLSALHLACKPSALGALLDRLDSAERDQRRYQWLRDEAWAGYNQGKGLPHVFTVDGAGNRRTMLAEEALDDAIDAALRSVGEKEPG